MASTLWESTPSRATSVADGGGNWEEESGGGEPLAGRRVGEERLAAGEIAIGVEQRDEVVDDRTREDLGPVEEPGDEPRVVGHRRQPEEHGRLAAARGKRVLHVVAQRGNLGGGRSQRSIGQADDRHRAMPQRTGCREEKGGVRPDPAAGEAGVLEAAEVGVDQHTRTGRRLRGNQATFRSDSTAATSWRGGTSTRARTSASNSEAQGMAGRSEIDSAAPPSRSRARRSATRSSSASGEPPRAFCRRARGGRSR